MGVAVHGRRARIEQRIELGAGDNRIEVGARSVTGVESLRAVQPVHYEARTKGELYFIALGVSRYNEQSIALGFADRDASDLTAVFSKLAGQPMRPALVNEHATASALAEAGAYLDQATVDDTVVVFVAGHGTLSPDGSAEFLFLPYEFDPARPLETAVRLSTLETLLSNVKARRRLLLIDSCVSGERDEDVTASPSLLASVPELSPRVARGIGLRLEPTTGAPVGRAGAVRLPGEYLMERDRWIFQDGVRRNGIVVFASSRWSELSYEHADWQNGAFTAELKRAFADPDTDKDGDSLISFDELVRAVRAGVAARTDGRQHPTVRSDNVDAAISFPAAVR
jgi:uncharacterized caspase-like protein